MQCSPDRHRNTKLPALSSLFPIAFTIHTRRTKSSSSSPILFSPFPPCDEEGASKRSSHIILMLRRVRVSTHPPYTRRTLMYGETYCRSHTGVYILNLQNATSISILESRVASRFLRNYRFYSSCFFFLPSGRGRGEGGEERLTREA